jgi:hypothetical protein
MFAEDQFLSLSWATYFQSTPSRPSAVQGHLVRKGVTVADPLKFWAKLHNWINVLLRKYGHFSKNWIKSFQILILRMGLKRCGDLIGMHLSSPGALVSAQLEQLVRWLTEQDPWMCCHQCSLSASETVIQGRLHIHIYLSESFKRWYFDNLYVLILLVAFLR